MFCTRATIEDLRLASFDNTGMTFPFRNHLSLTYSNLWNARSTARELYQFPLKSIFLSHMGTSYFWNSVTLTNIPFLRSIFCSLLPGIGKRASHLIPSDSLFIKLHPDKLTYTFWYKLGCLLQEAHSHWSTQEGKHFMSVHVLSPLSLHLRPHFARHDSINTLHLVFIIKST